MQQQIVQPGFITPTRLVPGPVTPDPVEDPPAPDVWVAGSDDEIIDEETRPQRVRIRQEGRHVLNVKFGDGCFHFRNGPCTRPDWDQRVPRTVCEPHRVIALDRISISRWGSKYHVNTECGGLRNATSTVETKRECAHCVRGF